MRYPGGKTKQIKVLKPILQEFGVVQNYIEPFVGGGSVLKAATQVVRSNQFIANEYDYGMFCYWHSVVYQPDRLIELIEGYTPSVEDFYAFKEMLSDPELPDSLLNKADIGFAKLCIHQISYSGLGVKAGSPIGGRGQKSAYPVGCRWNPKKLVKDVRYWAPYPIIPTYGDFTEAIGRATADDLIYLDPPYWDKGGELYLHSMSPKRHYELADALMRTPASWVLSYDPNPIVDRLSLLPGVEYSEVSQINTIEGKRTENRRATEPILIRRSK